MRTSPILGLLICSAIIVNVANAKPIFIKVFAPSSGYSYQTTPTAAPANTQFISNLISQKIQLLTNFLQAKSSLGNSFGFTKTFTFNGPATTTTESPVITHSTEVTTDFIPEVSSSTQSVFTTTTEGDDDIATPKPTVHPLEPVTTSTTTSTPVTPGESTTEEPSVETTTRDTHGYSYQTPTSRLVSSNTVRTYY